MKSRLYAPAKRKKAGELPKQEANRRLTSLGLSRHDDEEVITEALAIVERFRRWTNGQPCCVTGARSGLRITFEGQEWIPFVQWAHITGKRGSWAGDFGVTAPLADFLHTVQEHDYQFFAKRGLNEYAIARRHAVRYLRQASKDCAWLLEHCNDGDVLAICKEAEESR